MKKIGVLTFNEWKKLNEKKEDQSYSSGCLMGFFENNFDNPEIKEDDLYNNEENEYGLEVEPHVTVLYGLKDDEIDESEIIKLFTMINGPEVETEQISLFKNEKFDVVKWDIISDELTILNKMVSSMFPFKSDYPDYHAHCTIAYCKPDNGDSYVKTLPEPIKQKIAYWVYSKANGKKIKIIPGKESEIMREATNESNLPGINNNDPSICIGSELNTDSKDESFDYNGYHVILTPHTKFIDAYICSVYFGDEYKMGIKGPVSLEIGKEAAINFINNQNGTRTE